MNYKTHNDQALKEANKVFSHEDDRRETIYDLASCAFLVVLVVSSIVIFR